MTVLFWVLFLMPIVLFVTSYLYYINIQRFHKNAPYAWQAIAVATLFFWIFALAVFLWNKGIIA